MARGQQQRCLALACLVAMCMSTASAFVFKAGGTGEWRVPGQANASGGNIASYNTWAEHTRFRVGDAIAFTYEPGKDSVLIVDEKAYDACDTASPVDTFSDGNTVFTFTKSGPFYFISGNKDNCNRNEKLVVVVMGPRAADNGTATHTALAPSPAYNGVTFSPPSPPPPFGIDISPTASEPSAAVAKAAGMAGTAAFVIGAMFYALV
ncbi:early nodulin-like protein 1 [Lolium rigidum]|uniref:early nodulin-like protein 1 n=1 Tax=Lolium rigidum TaxID=89674 RepID=UPI001F5D7940|nr:early nodulin-like protein 1 [Lolium rigidum]